MNISTLQTMRIRRQFCTISSTKHSQDTSHWPRRAKGEGWNPREELWEKVEIEDWREPIFWIAGSDPSSECPRSLMPRYACTCIHLFGVFWILVSKRCCFNELTSSPPPFRPCFINGFVLIPKLSSLHPLFFWVLSHFVLVVFLHLFTVDRCVFFSPVCQN